MPVVMTTAASELVPKAVQKVFAIRCPKIY
jgi:hypothetical protein